MPVDPELTDSNLGSEIELLADVIDLASSTPGTVTEEELDRVLGVLPRPAPDKGGARDA